MINCITIDDEPLALAQLEKYISKIPDLNLVEGCYDVFRALHVMEESEIDLIFLDINMPDANGMDWAKSLGEKKPYIIFTTAYSEYAVDGFRVDAVDYLLKPFGFNEFSEAIEKVKRRIGMSGKDDESDNLLMVKEDSRVRQIRIQDILYVKSMSEYVQIFLDGNQRPVTTLMSMKRLEALLPKGKFMRIHRSYIIHLDRISSVHQSKILLEGTDTLIPLSDSYRDSFNTYMEQRLLNRK